MSKGKIGENGPLPILLDNFVSVLKDYHSTIIKDYEDGPQKHSGLSQFFSFEFLAVQLLKWPNFYGT